MRLLTIGGTLDSVGVVLGAAGALAALSFVAEPVPALFVAPWFAVAAVQPPVAGVVAEPGEGACDPVGGVWAPVDGICTPVDAALPDVGPVDAEPTVGLVQLGFEPVSAVAFAGCVFAGGGVAEFEVDCPLGSPDVTAASALTRPWP